MKSGYIVTMFDKNPPMMFEIGNGYGHYCELGEESYVSQNATSRIENSQNLNKKDTENPEPKPDRQIVFLVGLYTLTVGILLFEYVIFLTSND